MRHSCSSISINVYCHCSVLFAIHSLFLFPAQSIMCVCGVATNHHPSPTALLLLLTHLSVFISANLFTNNPYHFQLSPLSLSLHATDPAFHYVCRCIDYNENRKSLLYWSMKMEIHLSPFFGLEVEGKFGNSRVIMIIMQ